MGESDFTPEEYSEEEMAALKKKVEKFLEEQKKEAEPPPGNPQKEVELRDLVIFVDQLRNTGELPEVTRQARETKRTSPPAKGTTSPPTTSAPTK